MAPMGKFKKIELL